MEAILTPLGLTHAELAGALGRYRLRLHALVHALGTHAPLNLHHDAYGALEDLGALIEVDLGARSTPGGAARMSELERSVLPPLLARLQERLAPLGRSRPSPEWIPLLQAADQEVAHVERALAGH